MAFPDPPPPKTLLGRHRLLSPTAAIKVSPICLGAMSFGDAWTGFMGECNKDTTFEILDYFFSSGGNFIDTANNYQHGDSERWLGEWMAVHKNRDQIVLATKYSTNYNVYKGFDGLIQTNYGGNGSKSLRLSLAASLEKLQTDYIDILYVHWWDYTTSIEELMQSLNALVLAGKVLYLGISDTPAWIVSKANQYARDHGLRQFAVYQGKWNAAFRDVERDILPMCAAEGMGIAPWASVGGGNFKAAALRTSAPPGRYGAPSENELKVSDALEKIAERKSTAITSVALAYVMAKAPYVFPIVGGRKVEHLRGNVEALGLVLEKEDLEEIEKAGTYDAGFPHNMLYDLGKSGGGAHGPEQVVLSRSGGLVDYIERPKSMIIRASRPRLPSNGIRSLPLAFEQLQLPWLCPALLENLPLHFDRSTATATKRRSIHGQRSVVPRNREPVTSNTKTQGRGFAYAAGFDNPTLSDDYIPFDNNGNPYGPQIPSQYPWSGHANLSELPSFDPTSILVIHDSLRQTPRKYKTIEGIGGELSQIHQTLQACLRVGRLERAAATVRRLTAIYKLDALELIEVHNDYLTAAIERVVQSKDQALLRHVQRWFEVEIRARGIPPNPTTYGLMLRASFQESNQLKIDRTIRRYIALAEQADVRDEALGTALNTLNSQEIGRVTHVCPTTFYNADDLQVEDNFDVQPSEGTSDAPDQSPSYDIRPQQQKGLGLVALKKSLSIFEQTYNTLPLNSSFNSEEAFKMAAAYERQKQLERDTVTSALDRWREEHNKALKKMGVNSGLQTKSISAVMWTWHEALVPLIREEILKANEKDLENDQSAVYGPFLQYISPEKLSAVTIIHILNRLSVNGIGRGAKVAALVASLAKAIQDESVAEVVKDRNSNVISRGSGSPERQKQLMRLIRRRLRFNSSAKPKPQHNSGVSVQETLSNVEDQEWPAAVRAQLGALLVSLLIQAAKIEVVRRDPENDEVSKDIQPVFWNSFRYENGRRFGVIQINAAMRAKLTKEPVSGALSKHLPMLVEPVPWTKYKAGGFLRPGVTVVRAGSQHIQLREYIRAAADSGDMAQVFAGLDVLGKTPWQINREVFNVMREVWNSGEALANIPAAAPKFQYPPEPNVSADLHERRVHAFRVREIENARDGIHSERCFLNFQLEVARAYLDETFYFPHNVDFRGRAYPIPPYLNHIGADNCRGLLRFGKGKELGESGLVWLKIHLANVFGFDKANFKERRDFAMNHVKDIYDSANDPLKGSRWWLQAEDPWQCLATCIELKNALESPDPTKFVSYLPVHQDGTCNGLQHYAALGGDSIGAKQVNLEPGDRPSDIYTAVAEMVKDDIAKEAAEGSRLAKLLEGKISRKIVKPTVMTNVYGVTFQGAKRQVASQLRDFHPDLMSDAKNSMEIPIYITRKIFAALAAMFNGAHDIQYWLGECASRICEALTPEQVEWIEANPSGKRVDGSTSAKATNEAKNKNEHVRFKSSVIWTTPLKMPVVQPYRTSTSRIVKTNLQQVSLNEPSASDPVSKRKQLQGFPPNFIHSLDATHMLLSAVRCNEQGLSFAAVHDSFWTHAADLDTMNGVLRDAFISMHSEDIIGRLAAEFAARYKDCMYLAHVKANSPLGKKIISLRASHRHSKRAKEQVRIDEMLLEKRRLRLLASTDPKEQAEGNAMVTPAKLFADTADEKDLMTLEEIQGLEGAIGQVSDIKSNDQDPLDTLEPVLGSSKLFAEDLDIHTKGEPIDHAEYQIGKRAAIAKQARVTRKTWLWLPLTFPPVPKKGDFNVSRLKDSKYFFS
ncbi:DNA-directed RNA polymerase [Xylographa trunciseda]|nr:DNA-directed RNA polymerase [Xylographa trunciseda]